MALSDINMIQPGWEVYGAEGYRMGTVDLVTAQYLVVTTGTLVLRDLFVPHDAVADAADGRVRLRYGKYEVESQGWDKAPGAANVETEVTESDDLVSVSQSVGSVADVGFAQVAPEIGDDPTRMDIPAVPAPRGEVVDVQHVPLHEEQLGVRTRVEETGELSIRRDVIEEEQVVDVPVRREELRIERRPVQLRATQGAGIIQEGNIIRIPVRAERLVITKETWVVEEVRVERIQTEEIQQVRETVRREQVSVDQSPVAGAPDATATAPVTGTQTVIGDPAADPYRRS
jgi:uncharacterized protein (TIGR02271 family)